MRQMVDAWMDEETDKQENWRLFGLDVGRHRGKEGNQTARERQNSKY